ncbi:MAG: CocE/NonD family hydrolase [Parasporobacterium sp.]|nr:CocE/NonD family hydrolase [Parasporobacterium sp.]
MGELSTTITLPEPHREDIIKHVVYPDGSECDVIFTKMSEPLPEDKYREVPRDRVVDYCLETPLNHRTYDVNEDIICKQDEEIVLRDGTKIYADIYLPKGAGKVPVIVSWSFFGKRPWEQPFNPMRPMGVPTGTVSDCCKFEAADPMYWCYQGYAVANVDPRGITNSEGDLQCFGYQEGQDGADFVEWCAEQEWCSGKVGLFGNSGVGMSQWRIAAERPPHLACIAPWEATGDMYRESLKEGGINGTFPAFIVYGARGYNYIDNMVAMAVKEPLVTSPYWQDKIPDFTKIRIPVYCCVNPNHFHCHGTWDGFNKIRSQKKWMRVHQSFEWPDTYAPENLEDLKRFFDRYLKDIHNGWEITPRIRMEVMDVGELRHQTGRPEERFPMERTVYKNLYLDALSGTAGETPVSQESQVSYQAADGEANFTYTFPEDTEINGYMRLKLFVEVKNNTDTDLFVNIKKDSTTGEELAVTIFGSERHPGAWGKMRVSLRHTDESKSNGYEPYYTYDREEKLEEGQIVPVEIAINPYGRFWHKGQKLRIQVAGRYIRDPWFEPLGWNSINQEGDEVILHTGGQYESCLTIPVIPPRFQDGDIVIR